MGRLGNELKQTEASTQFSSGPHVSYELLSVFLVYHKDTDPIRDGSGIT